MAKDFKDNPAFTFLKGVAEDISTPDVPAANKAKKKGNGTHPPSKDKSNSVFSTAGKTDNETGTEYRVYKDEPKSSRVLLLLQPTLQRKIKIEADKKGVSVNEFIHQVLKNHIEGV